MGRRSPEHGAIVPVVAAAIFSTLVCTAALCVAAQLWAPEKALPAGLRFLRPSIADGEVANRMIEQAWPTQDRRRLDQAKAATERELASSPASGSGWLRLAIIETAISGRMTAPAQWALARSYDVAPLDPGLIVPRVRFTYDHWAALTSELRLQAITEVETVATVGQGRAALTRALQQLESPLGQATLRIKLQGIDRRARARQLREQEAAEALKEREATVLPVR